jgi:regulator of protease activity HflC (stomatin/prohibitin superfamily)
MDFLTLVILATFGLLTLSATLKVFSNWERAVILRLGKFQRLAGPGLNILIPIVDRAYRVDTRIVTMDVPRQEMMTRDNVPVTVDAIVLFYVVDPTAAILKIENFILTTSLIAQTSLRSTIGQVELDDLLSRRERVNQQLQSVIDEQTEPYGVKVSAVEVRDVILPETMKRAMAAQAEAERDKRAKIINAEGEYLAAERLAQAAHTMSKEPAALQLRYLQSMREIASERSSMTILPIPVDLLTPFLEIAKRAATSGRDESEAKPSPPPAPSSLTAPEEAPALENGSTIPALEANATTPTEMPLR